MSENPPLERVAVGPNILVVGDSCSGKTTVAAALAQRLALRHIELDALNWEPNWTEASDAVFLDRVLTAIAEPGWALDGNYNRVLRPHTWTAANTIVWLDFPLRITIPRTLARSWRRWRTGELLWGTNRERLWEHLLPSNRSLIWWTLTTHGRRREAYADAMTDSQWEGTQFMRLRSPAEVERFLADARLAEPRAQTA